MSIFISIHLIKIKLSRIFIILMKNLLFLQTSNNNNMHTHNRNLQTRYYIPVYSRYINNVTVSNKRWCLFTRASTNICTQYGWLPRPIIINFAHKTQEIKQSPNSKVNARVARVKRPIERHWESILLDNNYIYTAPIAVPTFGFIATAVALRTHACAKTTSLIFQRP